MTVTNNGSTTINSITPSLTEPGTVGWTKVSGPVPENLGGLIPGESDIFKWVYTITGSVGNTFSFSGYATSGALTSIPNPAYSNQGIISAYSVSVSPDKVCSTSTNVTFTFSISNSGGYPVQQVLVTTPVTGFVYSSASGGCTGAWTVSTADTPTEIKFTTGADYIPVGGTCNFSVTYSSLPSVTSNSDYNFKVDIWDTQTPLNKDPRASLGAIVKVTKYCITLTASPDTLGPDCTATVIATITPSPPDGSAVNFTANGGTLYDISTTASGIATAVYRAPNPYNASFTSATVSALFEDASASTNITLTDTASCSSSYYKRIRWREVVK